MNREIHVSAFSKDPGRGTADNPFSTIKEASAVALPGDTITIHEGVYREWVNPPFGGENDKSRIVYRGAPGEKAVISGSEKIDSWEKSSPAVWKADIPNSFFGDYNPYENLIAGDWFDDNGRQHHTGEVYINGQSLFEVDSLEKVMYPEGSVNTWYCQVSQGTTTIWANFGDLDLKKSFVEINVRPHCFWPEKTGINYITVKGLILTQAATQWAPPTAEQQGLMGPHWSKGWIIEDNEISHSKCSGISLGKEKETGHNEWSELGFKHGTQREREVIFRALRKGWSKENIGSHIIRNNSIHDCEQTGICGHLGAIFSTIEGNHIYNIHVKRLFKGAEIAGIKLHAPIDTMIARNRIHNADRGIWMDWQAQGTRISGNLLYDNDTDDLFIEVSHGPYIVDNNIFLSELNLRDVAQGGAFVHNLFAGRSFTKPIHNRYTPYHYPHETTVAGLMTIQGGDNRYYNNIFLSPEKKSDNSNQERTESVAEGAFTEKIGTGIPGGTHIYNGCPAPGTKWYEEDKALVDYLEHRFPMYCASNIYYGGTEPYEEEENPLVVLQWNPVPRLGFSEEGIFLTLDVDESFEKQKTRLVDTDRLGHALQAEAPFENPDGTPLIIDRDYNGSERHGEKPTAGPFESLRPGKNRIRIG